MSAALPVIDVSKLTSKYLDGNGYKKDLYLDPDVQQLSKEIVNAFTEFGFVYIKGHNIDESLIDRSFKKSREFFKLEDSIKNQFLRDPNYNWGYVPFNVETFDKTRPYDLKECFNMYPLGEKKAELEQKCPEFWETSEQLFTICKRLSYLFLKMINISLKTDNPNFLYDKHQKYSDATENPTIVRLLYYPTIEKEENVLEKQLRCGEHSDYGTITFLFQDEAGGLQVVSPTGGYIDAVPIPGCIVVNCGDMLEIWSGNRLKSTRHRVVVPTNLKKPRQSIAFFVHPDKEVDVYNLESNEEKPKIINSYEYLMKKFSDTY